MSLWFNDWSLNCHLTLIVHLTLYIYIVLYTIATRASWDAVVFWLLLSSVVSSTSLPCLQIYYYANSIYSSAGVDESNIQYVTVGTGAVNVFMTIAAVGAFLLKRWRHCVCVVGLHQRRRQSWTLCLTHPPGVHRGGLGPTAAPPLWLRDLLWSLRAAHCRS